MKIQCSKVRIQNFKSLKDVEINLNKLNVLIGPNDSGKTNLLEFFKFIKNVFSFNEFPYRPLKDWWSYNNVVFQGDETQLITSQFEFNVAFPPSKNKREKENTLIIMYSMSFGREKGIYQIIHEDLELGNITIKRELDHVIISLLEKNTANEKKKIKENIIKNLKTQALILAKDTRNLKVEEIKTLNVVMNRSNVPWSVLEQPIEELLTRGLLQYVKHVVPTIEEEAPLPLNHSFLIKENEVMYYYGYFFPKTKQIKYIALKERIEEQEQRKVIHQVAFSFPRFNYSVKTLPTYFLLPYEIISFFRGILFLRHPLFKKIREPSIIQGIPSLLETSENLHSVLFQYFEKNNGMLPESVRNALSIFFEDKQIRFERTTDGRSYIALIDNDNNVYNPPSISDGFYKIMSLLIANEDNNSRLVLIDEIENSLYYQAIKFILDEYKYSPEKQFLITTYSTFLIDHVNLTDLLLFKKENNQTQIYKIRSHEVTKLKEYLVAEELGYSDALLSGVLFSETLLETEKEM